MGVPLLCKIKSKEVARKKKQEGIQGQWQHESPAREYLEQVKCCSDTDCTPWMLKQAFFSLKGGVWEEYKGIFRVQAKAAEWAFDRIQEAFEKVAKDEGKKAEYSARSYVEKYRLLAAHYRASRRARRQKEAQRCLSGKALKN